MVKLLLLNPFVMFSEKEFHLFTLHHYFSIGVKMSWNNGDSRNLFLRLKSKLELYQFVFTTPKTSPEKLTLTLVEMQQMPDIKKSDSKEEISCLKRTLQNGKRKVCVNFQTETDTLNVSCTVTETNYTSKIVKLIWN